MDDAYLASVMVLVGHVLGGRPATDDQLAQALHRIGQEGRFEALGHAVFIAMLRANIARLSARRSSLVEQLSQLPKPPLH
jgi:hypothetical protein